MAIAAFKLLKCTGTNAGTETDVTKHPCFLNADIASTDTSTYPVPAPASVGLEPTYSYEIWVRWECTTAPDNQCINFKFYGPNTPPDSPANKLLVYSGKNATGVTPVKTQSTVATTRQDTNYTSSGTGLAIDLVPGDNKIDAIGEKTKYLVLQLRVYFAAAQGEIDTLPFNLSYEES